MGETIRHTCGDHVCWTRMMDNGDTILYTRDIALKQSIMASPPSKWVDIISDPFDDDTIPVCNGNALMIIILTYGHAILANDEEMREFRVLSSNREFKFKY